jgi:hypothetical protein
MSIRLPWLRKTFNESDHPRDHGQFASKPGEHHERLAHLAERSRDPDAVADHEVESALAEAGKLSREAMYKLMHDSGMGEEIRPRDTKTRMLQRLRLRLTAAKRARERAEV